ncbi:hypothetical protein [Pandoraea apista]|uniref:hypothetical protein n=1 Tax=Pandoraea apista TaxID=93218 RepID=UPI000F675A87|nr:hypothetical protein [Pandoraea apista]RRW94305.1 hypothetical protein EGJ54_18390 [Pandoraea apista]RRX00664.1 hypothetical protein EGJ56_19035 [Pandoraea apista]
MPAQAAKTKTAKAKTASSAAKAIKPLKPKKPMKTATTVKSKSESLLGKLVRTGLSRTKAAARAEAVGRARKEDQAPKRRTLSNTEAAKLRHKEAEANHDELPSPTKAQLLDFQLDFLIDANLLLYTENPVTFATARSARPDPEERLAGFLERTFGTRKPDAMIARFVPLSDFGGNTMMKPLHQENAGPDVNAVIDRARARADERVDQARETLRAKHKQRLANQRAEQARLARNLSEYPARWLRDLAVQFDDLNNASGGQVINDSRVVQRLFDIARRAEEQGTVDGDDEAATPVEFIVGEVIEAYNAMALHERRQREADRKRIQELEEQLARLREPGRAAG